MIAVIDTAGNLALRVLEPRASAALTVLLALLLARVAREEAGLLQRGPQGGIVLLQRARDAEADRTGLAGVATALDRDVQIEVAHVIDRAERVEHVHAQDLAREVLLGGAPVDRDRAVAQPDEHARARSLASARGVEARGLAGHRHQRISRVAGFCAACGCSAPASTFSLPSTSRPTGPFGSMPVTAWPTTPSG